MYYPLFNHCAVRAAFGSSAHPCVRVLAPAVCGALLLIGATTPASADVENIQSLTNQALQLDQAARLIEDVASTANSSVEIYIGDRIDGLLLHHVRAQIDDERVAQYDYSETEAVALSKGAAQRLLSLPLAPGSHRVRIEYIARSTRNLPSDDLIRGKIDQKIETSSAARWVEAELVSQGMVNKTTEMKVRVLSATPASAVPLPADEAARINSFGIGSDEDPRVRLSRFLLSEDRPFSAASELMHVQASSSATELPNSFSVRLSSVLADLGQSAAAEAPASDASGSAAAPSAIARYQLAVQQLAQGQGDQAKLQLDQLGQTKPVDSAGWALRDAANLSLGYAQLHAGQATAAATAFGRVRAQGPFSARALLGMGWAYLDSGGGNIKANDPAAKPARDASDVRPTFISDVEAHQGRNKLHFATASAEQLTLLRHALVPWTELIGRNPMDPAVQEGLVAIGYGLDHVGAYVDAQLFYKRAVKLQETTLVRLDEARAQVSDGYMLAAVQQGAGNSDSGWHWQLPSVADDSHWWLTLNDDPKVQANFYFDELLGESAFNSALSEYRGLQNLIATGDEHLRALASSGGDPTLQQQLQTLRAQLLSALTASGDQLKTVALADLQQEQKQAQSYLVEARFALARSNDWAPTELATK